ncbi:hypothetical protein C7S18_07410 [Ahniella affigens]|uniref:GrpB family protein n=1 Tax=Ahniella affigens TaxID=2021234 RepID=A0A2P1PYW8_9GAMM|nr:GrpB family protein [Ahniella affigens]AVQ00040.1 hypothetical protein C7S18_07410 [Ahniella affigens]
MNRTICIGPYDPSWATRFQSAADELLHLLGTQVLAIHHIGSTAVPGLVAKPTIDLLMEVRDLDALALYRSGFETLGYVWRGENGISGRCYFQRGKSTRTHHLHAYVAGHPEVARHLRFRDYLLAHPEAVEQYSRAKFEARAASAGVAAAYQQHKSAVVESIAASALRWSQANSRDCRPSN